MDLAAWLLLIAFEGIIGSVAVLLSLTYVAFTRMEKNVRRARMFIMADRIQRFLGAFTLGFVVLTGTFATTFLGITLPSAVGVGAFFFFLSTIAYGAVELFLIVRPKQLFGLSRPKSLRLAARRGQPASIPATDETVAEEVDAAR